MENDAARVICDITNTPIFVPEGKGEINVCKAVQDMIYEREKLAEIRTIVKQIQKGRLTIEQAAEDSNMTVEQFKEAMSKLPQESCIMFGPLAHCVESYMVRWWASFFPHPA